MSGESRGEMAVTKIWPVKSRLDHVIQYAENMEKTAKALESMDPALDTVLRYAKNQDKTEQEYYVTALNCYEDTVKEEFEITKRRFGKMDGILAYHGYMSFNEEEVNAETAHAIGIEVAEKLWGEGFQVLVTTHLNTKCLHNHFVINSVSFKDGKRCRGTSWFKNRTVIDEICKAHGLSVVENAERNPDPAFWKTSAEEGGMTRYDIVRSCIDEAIQRSRNLKGFEKELTVMGFSYKLSENRKYWTVTPKGWKRSIRLYRLGSDYTNQRIKERIQNQTQYVVMEDFMAKDWRRSIKKIPPRKKGSLQGLYLHYCYLLGILPKHKPYEVQEIHPLCREELLKLEHITKAAELLCENQIDSAEQLLLCKENMQKNLQQLMRKRQDLRKLLRRKEGSERKEEIQGAIQEQSIQIKTLRQKIRLCDEILERSEVLEQKLEVIENEEKNQGKDVREDAYRR